MKTHIVRNGLWNASATALGIVTGVVGTLIIPRSLTAHEYGLFSYYIWLAGIIGLIGTLAFPGSLTKVSPELRGREQPEEARALSLGIVLVLLVLNLLLSAGLVFQATRAGMPDRMMLFIVALVVVPKAMGATLRSMLMGQERYTPVSLTMMAGSILQLVLIVTAALAQWGAPGFVAAMLVGGALQVVGLALAFLLPSGWTNVRRLLKLPTRDTLRCYTAFLVPSTICLVSNQIVWERSEVFFLRWSNAGMEQIGFYSLAYTIFIVLFGVGGALLNPFQPSISYDYGAGHWSAIQAKVQQGVLIATLYAVPISLGGWVTFDHMIPLLVTAKMVPAVAVTKVLFIGLLPASIGVILGLLLSAAGGIWMSARLGIMLSIVNIALDILLIPPFQALGGAVANTCAQILFVVLLFFAARRLYRLVLPWRDIRGIVLIGVATTLVLPWLVQQWVPGPLGLVLAIGAGGVATCWQSGQPAI
ncbi:MAG: oligosaccharide flippase family protein [Chloroflexaceae bacterium]|nr:oligosaccharide flippase family protein [Chloroflexaceae bacterium]